MYGILRRKDNKEFFPNHRQQKKGERKGASHPVMDAYYRGQWANFTKSKLPNPYPPGLRHNAWQEGYEAGICEDEMEAYERSGPRVIV